MDIREIADLFQTKLASSKKTTRGHEFENIFDRKLLDINATSLQGPADAKASLLEKSDKILNLLDDYTRELTDPGKTLKDIEPLVTSIQEEVTLIEAEAAGKVHNDRDLERFIKDLAVTANVVALKFHRGDYI